MKFIISGKNIVVTEALKEKVISKLSKLERFFHEDARAHITMSVQKTKQIVEVTIPLDGIVLRAEERNEDMYASIDKVVDVLERQVRKHKTKLSKKLHSSGHHGQTSFIVDHDAIKEKVDDFEVVRTKRFLVKPMDIEEAILQMNLLGHKFYVFLNVETKQINVVYHRNDGDYGLIEPEF